MSGLPVGDQLAILVGIGAVIVAVITLAVVIVQVNLARGQNRLASRQLTIVEKQDEILNRRSLLRFQVLFETGDSRLGRVDIYFVVQNSGPKSARDFYWHLYLPKEIAEFRSTEAAVHDSREWVVVRPEEETTRDGRRYRHIQEFWDHPIYPNRALRVARITLDRGEPGRSGFRLLWQVVAEDGAFPSQDQLAEIDVIPPPPPPVERAP